MISFPIYNLKGEKTQKKASLSSSLFEKKADKDLIHQVVISFFSRQRKGTASTKTRGEVRGGGRKPWRQKGTGRARAGSIRSPLWRGGGVVFGPTPEKNYKKDIPYQFKRKVFLTILADKIEKNKILVVEDFKIDSPKTKKFLEILNKLFAHLKNEEKPKSALIILPKKDINVQKSCTNIPKVHAVPLDSLNLLDLLKHDVIIISVEGLKKIEEKYGEE